MSIRPVRRPIAVAAIAALALTVSACGSGAPQGREPDGTLLVWSLEVQPDRVAATKAEMAKFTSATGIEIELVPVEEAQVPQLLAAAALADEMPDVIGSVSLGLVRSFDGDDYLNRDAAAAVVKNLGADTWNEGVLSLTQDDGEQLAVPSDAWGQILVYRTDKFAEAGLEPPTTYEALLTAAETLTEGSEYGISLATDAADPFTQQTFEALALGNNCQLVDDAGEATLDSKECTTTIELYGKLSSQLSPDGTQTVDSTRASYFSGQAAMTIWSSFLLDELAGLRNDAAPSCPECTEPDWLARNSGVVPLIVGPDANGNEGSYGEMTSWVITSSAAAEDAQRLVEFMLSDGYAGWFGMAPEGKFPVRPGTKENPTEFIDKWATLPAGVDVKKPLAEVYSEETISTIMQVPANIDRWALPLGQGALLGPLTAELPLPKVIADLSAGSIDATTAQQRMQEAVAELASR